MSLVEVNTEQALSKHFQIKVISEGMASCLLMN